MDVRKLKDKATEAFSKGKFAKAGEAYAEYCAADPKDLQARLRMGDAWSKAGQKEKAIGAYQFAAEGFAKEGFLPRAIAASKLILELDPSHKGVQKMLAELYARKSGPTAMGRPKTVAGLKVPIDLPPEAAGAAAPEIVRASEPVVAAVSVPPPPPPPKAVEPKVEEVVAIEIEDSKPPVSVSGGEGSVVGIELDVSVTGGGVAPQPELKDEPMVASPRRTTSGAYELDLEGVSPPPPGPAVTAPSPGPLNVEAAARPSAPPPTSGAYELDLDEPTTDIAELPTLEQTAKEITAASGHAPDAYDLDLEEPATEVSELPAPTAVAESAAPEKPPAPAPGPPPAAVDPSAALKRTSSGAYELDLDDAPAEEPAEPIELTSPKPKIDEDALVAELGASPELPPAPEIQALPPEPGPRASSPPGLKPKKASDVPPAPAESAPRIWLPGVSEGSGAFGRASALEGSGSFARGGAAAGAAGRMTDLERSLEAFARFDDEVQIFDGEASGTADLSQPAAPSPPPASAHSANLHSFTELELEGDSLLHAVELAAEVGLSQRGQAAEAPIVEERMEAPEEQKSDSGALPKIPLFSDLPEDAFIALFERCPLRRLEPGDLVIQQGTLGDSFFVICAGTVKVFRNDGEVRRDIATLNEGAFFGEMALLSGAARTASVEAATEDTQLLEISAPILTELSHKYPPVASALKKFCRQRLLTNVMNSSALFAPFSRSDRRVLVERFRARDVQKGDVLIKEGERSDGMYIVLSGEIDVRVGRTNVAALKEGDIFGEMSLLTKAPATATCAAARRTSLLRLPREDFDQIVLSHPQILVLVSELTDERKKQNAAMASRAPKTDGEATPMV